MHGLGLQAIEVAGVQPTVIGFNIRRRAPAHEHEHGLVHDFAFDVPKGNVDGADGRDYGAFPAECDRRAVHFFEKIFGI
ncbi:hypothetical protein D3C87_1629700 [compost metagenome]